MQDKDVWNVECVVDLCRTTTLSRRIFSAALAGRGEVLAADASLDAPAMSQADRVFVVPPVSDPNYIETLLKICQENQVRLLISLNDLELPILSQAREQFLQIGTIPVVSEPRVIEIGFDKHLTHQFLQGIGLRVPQQYLTLEEAQAALKTGELQFPLVVKPRWGTASIGIDFPEDDRELELSYALNRYRVQRSIIGAASSSDLERSVMIQGRLQGNEYGLDVVNDLEGNYVTTFVKRKLAMRAGETDRASVVDEPELVQVGEKIGRELRHIGNLDCDVFLTPNGPYVLELNPRFGGGYPFSQEAGANVPAALLAWANHEKVDPAWLKPRVGWTGSKCDVILSRRENQS